MKTKDKEKLIRQAMNEFIQGIDISSIRHEREGIFFISNGYHYKLSNDGTLLEIGAIIDNDERKEV